MSIPWDVVGSVLGVAGGATWLWFIKMRTVAKLKDLKQLDVYVEVRSMWPLRGNV